MSKIMVRYKTKPVRAQENEQLIRAVYEELHSSIPVGLHYATFRMDDGVSFVHIASNETDGPSPLAQVPAFQRFQRDLSERCAQQPASVELHEIGSYRFWQ
jgi:hypothetical protein